LLAGLLHIMAHLLSLQPLVVGSRLTEPTLQRCCTLLLSTSMPLQAAAMRYLASVLNSTPLAPISTVVALDTLAMAVQQSAPVLQRSAQGQQQGRGQRGELASEAAGGCKWWQQVLALLAVVLDRATACPSAESMLLPPLVGVAATAVSCTGLPDDLQLHFCQVLRSALLLQPSLLESSCPQLLASLVASPTCLSLLVQCLEIYMSRQQQMCGRGAVSAAFTKAAVSAGLIAEVGAARSRRVPDISDVFGAVS
jgi:hypothetical protein